MIGYMRLSIVPMDNGTGVNKMSNRIKEISKMRKELVKCCDNKKQLARLAYLYITQGIAILGLLGDNKYIAMVMYDTADHFATLDNKE